MDLNVSLDLITRLTKERDAAERKLAEAKEAWAAMCEMRYCEYAPGFCDARMDIAAYRKLNNLLGGE